MLSFLGFALVGFCQVAIWIVKLFAGGSDAPQSSDDSQRPAPKASLVDDVAAVRRILDLMHSQSQLSDNRRQELWQQLDDLLASKPSASRPETGAGESQTSDESSHVTEPASVAAGPIIVASLSPVDNDTTGLDSAELASPATTATAAPWDLPDPPAPTPRRSLQELLGDFMEERNMRWAELTSGLLIVMSVVGLVVSLRDQLTDRIPYFSALLFLLITAAIHGTGIYTLKQWRLANTSRGTLIIGLLMIPINFFAACLLNGQPEDRATLDDPLYWIAIVVGMASLGGLAWYSSRLLFRKGVWPIVVGTLGSGAATLFINRAITSTSTAKSAMLASMPIMIFLLLGSLSVSQGFWISKRYSGRSSNRVYTFLGLAIFAALNAVALVLARSESSVTGLTATLPTLAMVGLVIIWAGLSTGRSAVAPAATRRLVGSQKTIHWTALTALTLQILGGFVMAAATFASLVSPVVALVSSLAASIGLATLGTVKRKSFLIPLAWALASIGGWVALMIALEFLVTDGWTTKEQLREAIFSAPTALYLLAVSLATGVASSTVSRFHQAHDRPGLLKATGWGMSLLMLLAGAAVGMVASLLNRDRVLDVTVASIVSGCLLVGIVSGHVWVLLQGIAARNRPTEVSASFQRLVGMMAPEKFGFWVPLITVVIAIIALWHVLIWDVRVHQWLAGLIGPTRLDPFPIAHVILMALAGGIGMAGLSFLAAKSIETKSDVADDTPRDLDRQATPVQRARMAAEALCRPDVVWAVVLLTVVFAMSLIHLMPEARGWASGLLIVGTLGWFAVGRALGSLNWSPETASINHEVDARPWRFLPALVAGVLATLVVVTEIGLSQNWLADLFDSRHGFILCISAAVISAAISTTRVWYQRRRVQNWLTDTWPLEYLLIGGASVLASVLMMDQVGRGVAEEVFGNHSWAQQALNGSALPGFKHVPSWMPGLSLLVVSVAVAVRWLHRPRPALGHCLIIVWFVGWAFTAIAFSETKAIASATRWLTPIAAIVLAGFLSVQSWATPLWVKLRAVLGQSGRSRFRATETRPFEDLTLITGAVSVLGISTLTTGQALMHSPQSLGGPLPQSIFKLIPIEANFGGPVAIVVATFLLLAITRRRSLLAMGGSAVFQFVVLMALYFLVASPHEKLASQWFVGILQAVSIGMTGYGFVWYFFRKRIEDRADEDPQSLPSRRLQLHTFVNGVLLTGMAGVVLANVFGAPTKSLGWISAFGAPSGLLTLVAFVALATLVWRPKLQPSENCSSWKLLWNWVGVVGVGLCVAGYNHQSQAALAAWTTHRLATFGLLGVGLISLAISFSQVQNWIVRFYWAATGRRGRGVQTAEVNRSLSGKSTGRVLVTLSSWGVGSLGTVAALQGLDAGATNIGVFGTTWFLLYTWMVLGWVAIVVVHGMHRQRPALGFVAVGIATIGAYFFCAANPNGWVPHLLPAWINACAWLAAMIALVWAGWLVVIHRRAQLERRTRPSTQLSLFPVTVGVLGTLWCLFGAVVEPLLLGSEESIIVNGLGIVALTTSMVLCVGNAAFIPDTKGRVFTWVGLTLVCAASAVTFLLRHSDSFQLTWYLPGLAVAVASWGLAWSQRRRLRWWISRTMSGGFRQGLDEPAVERLRSAFEFQLPIYTVVVSGMIVVIAVMTLATGNVSWRVLRFAVAFAPLGCAFSMACQSNAKSKRWLQMLCIAAVTLTAVLITFAQLVPSDRNAMKLLLRAFSVSGISMFVYGGLVARWVRPEDRWLKSLKQMAVVVCGCAVILLFLIIAAEASEFVTDQGCGLTWAEGLGTAVVIFGMIVGLVLLAIKPKNDPFSMSIRGRMAYVYCAQVVAAALVAHLYLSSPWLFQLGLRRFWPFVAMAICFVGVGVAETLKKRNLDVLSVPLFQTAVVLPVLVAVFTFVDGQQSQVALRPATVMFAIGLLYLLICYTQETIVGGAMSVLFGNAALWLLLNHYPAIAFLQHPQLWLIPPAVSLLLASQWLQHRLHPDHLRGIRYFAAAVIYISSTSEIFMRGIGDSIAPPMVLAGLAIAGILAGMLMRVKAFLYFGVLFLMMALLTMVSHAHRRFDHVWPWWAFGIGMGVIILVLFGMFEKRKNELKKIAETLNRWD